jgi:Uma2 family endonuclease
MPTDVLVSPEEYLARERRADEKHEYRDGEIVPMSGATREHVLIATNILFELEGQLRHRDCFVYSTDLRVRTSQSRLFTYADVAVVCGEPQVDNDEHQDVLLNPDLLIEVLSSSTRDYDRGEKFARYRTVESLREYVLVDQETPHVEHFARQPDGRWILSETDDAEAVIELTSVEVELSLPETYHKVDFDE